LRESQQTQDEIHRATAILNIVLIASIGLFVFLYSTIIYNRLSTPNYGGMGIVSFGLIVLFFVCVYITFKQGHLWFAAYCTIGAYFVGSFYCGYSWGARLPETLLLFTLVTVMANLLLGMKKGLVIMVICFMSLSYLAFHEMNTPEITTWRNESIVLTDVIPYFCIIGFMFALSWISRHHMDRSLDRALLSEQMLQKERDLLEVKVAERTRQLAKTQEERLADIAHITEFGQLSQGLFHDLLSPLSAMALQIERMENIPERKIRDVRDSIEQVSKAGKRFAGYLSSIRSAIGSGNNVHQSSFNEELDHVISLLSFRLRETGVLLRTPEHDIGMIPIDAVQLNRILLNVLSNAIDAYEGITDRTRKLIEISTNHCNNEFIITVRDHGCGIRPEYMTHIFEPFFTTKEKGKGTGIGLASLKRMLNKIGGDISLDGKPDNGTTITIRIPQH
ncbi:MAG: GHKL domain-containing protein, partial [Patescibacteria group bacterium]|nr:GHKL domain-containing protein [Patescibacteria group bacterium]